MSKTKNAEKREPPATKIPLELESLLSQLKCVWKTRAEIREKNLDKSGKKVLKDSTIKKVNSCLRKLKSLGENCECIDTIVADMEKLKLGKYKEEIMSILFDLKISRKAEIFAFVKVCSVMHREYPEFTNALTERLFGDFDQNFKIFKKIKEEEIDNSLDLFIKKQQKILRLITELTITNVLISEDGLVDIVRGLIKRDSRRERHFIVPVILAHFLGYAGYEVTGKLTGKLYLELEKYGLETLEFEGNLDEITKNELYLIVEAFYKKCSKRLLEIFKYMTSQDKELTQKLKKTGFLSDKQLERQKLCNDAFNRLYWPVLKISDAIGYKMPKVGKAKEMSCSEILESITSKITQKKKVPLFENEEKRAFYEELVDLRLYVSIPNDENQSIEEEPEFIDRGVDENEYTEKKNVYGFPLILDGLRKPCNKNKTDDLTERYCSFHDEENQKALINQILGVKNSLQGNIIYYSRMIASLSPYYPKMKEQICERLEKQFYRLLSNNSKSKLNLRLKNISFIAEFTKFKLFPIPSVTSMLNKLMNQLTPENVQLVCSFLETSGRWLYKNPVTHEMCKNVLVALQEKSRNRRFDESMKLLVQMACLYCCPPQVEDRKIEKLSPEKAYIRHILYERLNSESFRDCLESLREMDWNDPKVSKYIRHCLGDVVSFSFEKLHRVAALVAALGNFYQFKEEVIDEVLEEIRLGLEDRSTFEVQRRLIYVRFLAELYAYNMVEEDVVFDTLYLLIDFDSDNRKKFEINQPIRNNKSEIEKQSTNYKKTKNEKSGKNENGKNVISEGQFRIRLICLLIERTTRYFSTESRKKLIKFLQRLKMFVEEAKKEQPLTAEIEFLTREIFKRYSMIVSEKYEENKPLIAQNYGRKVISTLRDYAESEKKDSVRSKQFDGENIKSLNSGDKGIEETERNQFKRKKEKSKEDILFEKEFDRTLKESIALTRHQTRKMAINDSSSYLRYKELKPKPEGIGSGSGKPGVYESSKNEENKSRYLILTKRGDSKPVLRSFDSFNTQNQFVIVKEDQKKRKEEQKRLKENVLSNILMSEIEEKKKKEKSGDFISEDF